MYEHGMFKCGVGDKDVDNTLSRMSADGWEAVGMEAIGGKILILAKRPRP